MTKKGYYTSLPQEEKDRLNALKKARRATTEGKRRSDNSYTKSRYGITVDEKEELLAKQGGVCAVCGSEQPNNAHGWHIDHDHATGMVRGILCHHCNVMLGQAQDSVDRLMAGAAYLLQFQNILELTDVSVCEVRA